MKIIKTPTKKKTLNGTKELGNVSGDRPPQGPASWTTMTASVAKLTGSQDGMAGGRSIHRPQGLGKIPRTFLGGPFHFFFFLFLPPSILFLDLIVKIK